MKKYLDELENKLNSGKLQNDFWQVVKKRIGKNENLIPPMPDEDNNKVAISSAEKSELFADYFEAKFTPEPTEDTSPDQMNPKNSTIKGIKIKSKQVKILLEKCNTKKATGGDNIAAIVLKKLSTNDTIVKEITKLFRAIIRTATWPQIWKNSRVTVLLKNKNLINKAKGYRPISLLPIISKLAEKLICHR